MDLESQARVTIDFLKPEGTQLRVGAKVGQGNPNWQTLSVVAIGPNHERAREAVVASLERLVSTVQQEIDLIKGRSA